MTSASPATETNATGSAPSALERLSDLVSRAEASALSRGTNNRNKALLKELCFAIVALSQLCASQQQQMADKPRIITP